MSAADAETIFQVVEAAELDLKSGSAQGVLEIASFPSFAKAHLLPAMVRLRALHPRMHLVLHERETPDTIDAVREGRCHLGVVFTYSLAPQREISGFTTQLLVDEPVYLTLPPRLHAAPDPVPLENIGGRIVDRARSPASRRASRTPAGPPHPRGDAQRAGDLAAGARCSTNSLFDGDASARQRRARDLVE